MSIGIAGTGLTLLAVVSLLVATILIQPKPLAEMSGGELRAQFYKVSAKIESSPNRPNSNLFRQLEALNTEIMNRQVEAFYNQHSDQLRNSSLFKDRIISKD